MTAHWIRAPRQDSFYGAVSFIKKIEVRGKPASARMSVSSVGIYEVSLNGKKVGDRLLTPGYTSYDKRGIQFQCYDLTGLLREENTVAISVAPGWAVGHFGFAGNAHIYADHVSANAEIILVFSDGEEQTVFTSDEWDVFTSEVTFAEIYNGETVDKTHLPAFLGKAQADEVPYHLIPDIGEEIREQETFKPTLIRTPKGEKVLDFSQNMTGYVTLKIKGEKGSVVRLHFGEVLDKDGNFYNENYRSAKNEITYILSGKEDVFKPKFSFQGFRYALIKEYPGEEIDLDGFTAVVIHSDIKRTGWFSCGNAKINQLYHNIIWGQKSNYVDIPTDCPQRDERLGWTGDAQVFCQTAAINYNVKKFFEKWLSDLRAEQGEKGEIYGTCPEKSGTTLREHTRISAAWGDAATIIPWTLYRVYGDKKILADNYQMMCRWVEYIRAASEREFLWIGGWHFGDWLALDAGEDGKKGLTDTDLIASAFYAYSVKLVILAGEVLEKDVADYRALYRNILKAFRETYLETILSDPPDGSDEDDKRKTFMTQTAMTLILKFGLCGDSEKKRITDLLVKKIEEFGGKMSTGFVGTPYIMHALSENGRTDVAYRLLFNEESPSWLYSVNRGATTMWEHWNGIKEDGSFWSKEMNSFNHYAYGAVGDWLYGVAAGIMAEEPGYRKVTISPQPDERLRFVECAVQTRYGKISSCWKYENHQIRYRFGIPDGVEARILLPDGRSETVGAGDFSF